MENLKTFEQLTDNELLALTQDQIDWYIKLKKAEAGVRIVACPETPAYREIPDRDLILYDVCGFNFEDRETAEEVAKLINSKISKAFRVDYDYYKGGGSDYKYAKPYDGNLVDVKLEKVYKNETYNAIRDILISNKKIEDAYRALKNEYDSQEESSAEIVQSIYDAISAARNRKQEFEDALVRIQEYLRLSNGDVVIAWNFYEKAYEITPAIKNRILENEQYLNAVAGYQYAS